MACMADFKKKKQPNNRPRVSHSGSQPSYFLKQAFSTVSVLFIYFNATVAKNGQEKHFIYVKRNHLYAKLQLLLIGIQMKKSLGMGWWVFFFFLLMEILIHASVFRISHSAMSWSFHWIDGQK